MANLLFPDGTPVCTWAKCGDIPCGRFWEPIETELFEGLTIPGCVLVTFFVITFAYLRIQIFKSNRRKNQIEDVSESMAGLVSAYEKLINASFIWALLSWLWYFLATVPGTSLIWVITLITFHGFLECFYTALHTFAFVYLCSTSVGINAMISVARFAFIWGVLYGIPSILCYDIDNYLEIFPYVKLVSSSLHLLLYLYLMIRVYLIGAKPLPKSNEILTFGTEAKRSTATSQSQCVKFKFTNGGLFKKKRLAGVEATSLLEATHYTRPIQPFTGLALICSLLSVITSIGMVKKDVFASCTYAIEAILLYTIFPFALYSTLLADSKMCLNLVSREEGYKKLNRIHWRQLDMHGVLGGGGAGTVVKATFRGKDVCVKKFVVSLLDTNNIDNFLMETSMLSTLNHKNVVKVIGICDNHPYLYLVMEYCNGGDLYNYIHNEQKALSFDMALVFINDIAEALEYIHQKGVVHRDIKSLNVLLDEDFRIKLADFELSRFTGTLYLHRRESVDNDIENDKKDKTKKIVGTPAWLSPEMIYDTQFEQISNSQFWLSVLLPFRSKKMVIKSQKSDIYAFGVLMYEILTRKDPPMVLDVAEILKTPKKEAFSPTNFYISAASDGTEIPNYLQQLIYCCVDISPDKRPTIEEIVKILKRGDKRDSNDFPKL